MSGSDGEAVEHRPPIAIVEEPRAMSTLFYWLEMGLMTVHKQLFSSYPLFSRRRMGATAHVSYLLCTKGAVVSCSPGFVLVYFSDGDVSCDGLFMQ